MTTKVETNYDFKQNPVRNFVHDTQNSAPAVPAEGQEYYNTTTKKKPYWNGSKWVTPVEIATDAQATAGSAEDVAINPKQLKTALEDKQDELSYTPEDEANKVTSISAGSTNTQYPTAKLLYDLLLLKAALASPAFTGTPTVPTATAGDNSTQIANTAFVTTAIAAAMTGALQYIGSWNTTNATDYSALNSYRPIKKGYLFRCTGSGCTIDGVEYRDGDSIVFNRDVATSTSITTAMVDKYDHTQTEDTVLLAAVQTLTNKTINGSNNTITNLALSMFTAGVVLTSMSNNPSDTAILTEKAISTLLALKAPLASPAFTGNPTAPTPTAGDNSTKIATTAFVKDAVDDAQSGIVKVEAYNNTNLTPVDGVCTWAVSHTLGTDDVICEVYEVSTGNKVIMDIEATSATTVTIKMNANAAVAANTYKAVIIGG